MLLCAKHGKTVGVMVQFQVIWTKLLRHLEKLKKLLHCLQRIHLAAKHVHMKPTAEEWCLSEEKLGLLWSFNRFSRFDKAEAYEYVKSSFCGVSEDLRAMSDTPFKYYYKPVVDAFIFLIENEKKLVVDLDEIHRWQLRNELFCGFSPVVEAACIASDILRRVGRDGFLSACSLLSSIKFLFDYERELVFCRKEINDALDMISIIHKPDFGLDFLRVK